MKEQNISAFMLERYRLEELNPDDIATVSEALAADNGLRARLEELEKSDRELRLRYPLPEFGGTGKLTRQPQGGIGGFQTKTVRGRFRLAGLAALVLAGILLPLLLLVFSPRLRGFDRMAAFTIAAADRPKGNALPNTSADSELALFLMGSQALPLPDRTILEEGNTVQLAYTAPAGNEHYGVIFSIDGRSVVTMHYPYRRGQSPRMISGRRTLLNQAYILDDAPDFEVFIMVVSDEPLDVEAILHKAQSLAENNYMPSIIEESKTIFEDSIVETIAVLKR